MRFTIEPPGEVDRPSAVRATERLRIVFLGCAAGAFGSLLICATQLDLYNRTVALLAMGIGGWALACIGAAWRAHAAIGLLENPDVAVTTDRRGYVFLAHGSTLLRFIAMPRGMLEQVVRDLPAARVVGGA